MGKWSNLTDAVAAVIRANGNREITGQVLQNALLNIISNLGYFASFAGMATPSTNPGTPDGPVYYFATQAGTYTNFGALVLDGACYILYWNGTAWSSTKIGLPTTAEVTSAMNALIATETATRQQADATLQSAIAAEATRATGKEQELDAKINAKTSDITVSQLAESTKQYIEASGGGTITNMPDEEDLTVENNVLRLKDRDNYHIVRKHVEGDVNVIPPSEIKNGINVIQHDANLTNRWTGLTGNSTVLFAGGQIQNGEIAFQNNGDNQQFIDWNALGNGITISGTQFIFDLTHKYTDTVLFDLQYLEGPFKQYKCLCDSTTDNSAHLNGLLNDKMFRWCACRRKVVIRFSESRKHNGINNNYYLFKSPIAIDGGLQFKNLELQIDTDVVFDFSEKVAPTKEQIETTSGGYPAGVETDFRCFNFKGIGALSIVGSCIKKGSERRPVKIDCGFSSLITNNNYYEGLLRSDGTTKVYSSFSNCVSVTGCLLVTISNVHVDNSAQGLVCSSAHADITAVKVTNVHGDNGITVSPISDNRYPDYGSCIRNCYCADIQDIGISVQQNNTIVEGCFCERCGNNNDPLSSGWGVNSSFNTGGAYDVELTLSSRYSSVPKELLNVAFIACTASDCYNYAMFIDKGSAHVNGCTFINMTPTYSSDYDSLTGFKFQAVSIRKQGTFVVPNSNGAIKVTSSLIKGVSLLSRLEGVTFYNCELRSLNTDSALGTTDNSVLIACDVDDMPYTSNILYQNALTQGTTTSRPTNVVSGFQFYDTTLGKPIWWNGTNWVDATGTTV